MFRRLVFENSAALFTLAAFIAAATIYVTFAWRALRMKRPQVAHFANLPFGTATPPSSAGFQPASAQAGLEAGAISNRLTAAHEIADSSTA